MGGVCVWRVKLNYWPANEDEMRVDFTIGAEEEGPAISATLGIDKLNVVLLFPGNFPTSLWLSNQKSKGGKEKCN